MTTAHTMESKSTSSRGEPSDVARRVLLVDDDPKYVRSIQRLLEADGWLASVADGPTRAFAMLTENQFAIVVSDYQMDDLDGVEFLSTIRHSAPESVRLLITGNSDFQVAVNAVNEGHVFRFVPKSATGETVVAAVREAGEYYLSRRSERNLGAQQRAQELRALEGQFDAALAGLWMAYQPIVSSSTGRTIAYEALLRSTAPDLNNPARILEAAERLNGVRQLGRTVRKRVAEELGRTTDIDFFVNLHALELMDEALYDPRSPLTPFARRIVLEITERVALSEVADIRDRVQRLRALGFRIAVDDLGAGYAGLGTLVDLEPEVVKLDMGLVRGVLESPTKQKLVRAIAALGRELGWMLVAEGVETDAERRCLVELGCDILQGYYFGKPAKLIP